MSGVGPRPRTGWKPNLPIPSRTRRASASAPPKSPRLPWTSRRTFIRGGQADLGGELHGPGGDPRQRLSLGALIALEDPQSPPGATRARASPAAIPGPIPCPRAAWLQTRTSALGPAPPTTMAGVAPSSPPRSNTSSGSAGRWMHNHSAVLLSIAKLKSSRTYLKLGYHASSTPAKRRTPSPVRAFCGRGSAGWVRFTCVKAFRPRAFSPKFTLPDSR